MVVAAVTFAVLLPIALSRTAPIAPAEASPDAGAAPSPEPAPFSEPEDQPSPDRILVIGDGYTAGTEDGGTGPANWTQLVSADLAAQGRPVEVTVLSAVGSGYVQEGTAGETFAEMAQRAGPGPYDLAVIFGSRDDPADVPAVQAAATDLYARLQQSSPGVGFVVIGPAWRTDDPPASALESSMAVERAAAGVQAVFVDPLDEGWFATNDGSLIGARAGYPTDEGHRFMADRIRTAIEVALGDPQG